ncbi:hypothetical protein [Kangiella shandongensis]|uniref:hypothetical protein n=1 Tax=Kangiella shandongensis TaxID=2763258 RepID=UPI001CBCB2A2|nr:hypothetical protein [Kangiella shandongensis]
MSHKNSKNKTYLQSIRLPILISSALAIVALCFLISSWYEKVVDYKQHSFSVTYNQGLADSTASFLGQLIEDGDIEAIRNIGQRLSKHPNIQKVAIYQRTGELIHEEGESSTAHSDPVIANISYDDHYNGYFIAYFLPSSELTADQDKVWLQGNVIWLLGAGVWLLFFIALNIKRWLTSSPKTNQHHQSTDAEKLAQSDNSRLLKQLVKQNLKQSKDANFDGSLIIKADWTKLDNQTNNKLLRILSRWLPQNGLIATQFNSDLLILGLDSSFSPLRRNPVYALEQSLKNLQLEPKIILHELDVGQDVCQTFFSIIEPGIWFEKSLKVSSSKEAWPAQKTIDIELEDKEIVELCQLPEPDAQQITLIERQIRFISDD